MTAYRSNFTATDAEAFTGQRADITEWYDDERSETITHPGVLVTGHGRSWLTTTRPGGEPLNILYFAICEVTAKPGA